MTDIHAPRLTRRDFIGGSLAVAAAATMLPESLNRVLAAPAACGAGLADIEHVVVVMQENRSFDHYLGSLAGVRGFADAAATRQGTGRSLLEQPDAKAASGVARPFRLTSQCSADLSHAWDVQHQSWNGGAMNGWLAAHRAADGDSAGIQTMGYYVRDDLPYLYALADAFTVCDHYHCSVFGPTNPNRLMSMTGTIDPAGARGGPVVDNSGTGFAWTTYPERLQAAGVSWKVYNTGDDDQNNMLALFTQYGDPTSPLYQRSQVPTFADFVADAASGNLPQVSWILADTLQCEHPPSAPVLGENFVSTILAALTARPQTWARTAMFLMHDENDGFFDHVAPPTAPPGTPGEYLSVSPLPAAAGGIGGPIGLGFRVPMLVISPFSRGGLVCSDTFDHTSVLRFLESRFGVEVPNLSAWRRATCGDLVSAFDFASTPDATSPPPALPAVVTSSLPGAVACSTALPGATSPTSPAGIPLQEPGTRRRASGPCASAGAAPATAVATPSASQTSPGSPAAVTSVGLLPDTGRGDGAAGAGSALAALALAALLGVRRGHERADAEPVVPGALSPPPSH